MTSEYRQPVHKPLKKRYRALSTHSDDSSSNAQAVEQNAIVENIIPYRKDPEPIGTFEANIAPPSYSITTSPPPYPAPRPCESDACTIPIVEPEPMGFLETNVQPPSSSVTTLPPSYPASPGYRTLERAVNTVPCSANVELETTVNYAVDNCPPGYRTPSVNDCLLNEGVARPCKQHIVANTENRKLEQPIESVMHDKCPQASSMSRSTISLNSYTYSGTGQSIPEMPNASKGFHSCTSPEIKAVEPQRKNSGSTVLDRVKPDQNRCK
nr:unnamed protein product [Callosobruchus analis]